MTRSPDRLFDLLPVVHRRRDAEQGHSLRALLQVISGQVDVVEDDIERLYENWFIETCEDWVVPYIGDLIGYENAHEAGEPNHLSEERYHQLNRILVPRREVANTLRYRRRKGTLSLLELLSHDVAGWPARAVEFYRLLAWFQPLNHQRLHRGRTADLRDGDALDLIDGPFDTVAHSVDVRRLDSGRTRGRYNIPSVGLFVWRLRAYPVTLTPACCLESVGSNFYTFSVLGNDAPLFTDPSPEPSPYHIAGPLHVPAPIRRRALERDLESYYGAGRSFAIHVDGWGGFGPDEPLPPESIVVADLTNWAYRPPRDRVAVDPVLGRIAFPPRQLPKKGVWVSYHHGFSDDTGGGEYPRMLSHPADAVVYRVGEDQEFDRINDALARWREERPRHAVVELTESGVHVEQINIDLEEGQTFQLRAADRTRPVLRLMDWQTARPDALWVRGAPGSRFTLDGILVTGRGVQCEGALDEVTIRHCTLVPGWSIGPDCAPRRPAEPSLELIDTHARVTIERSIVGSVQISQDEVGSDPIRVRISDSILDATGPEREAIGGPSWSLAHAVLTIERTTVFGEIQAHAIQLAENSIFTGKVRVARRQIGCMRFCYVRPGSRTPRRYRCQPDLAEQAVRDGVPTREIEGEARVVIAPAEATGAGGTVEDCGCGGGSQSGGADGASANLDLTVDIDNPAPAVGDLLTLTVSAANRGPRAVTGAVARITPPGDCLDLVGDPIASQGVLDTSGGSGDESAIWTIGSLAPGRRAVLTVRVKLTGPCDPPALTARFTSYSFSGDGRPFINELIRRERLRVIPRFTSDRYGDPAYAQLALACPPEIARGADDESEMGAFHNLFQPQRDANLEARLDEFTPAGMDAGVIHAT